MEKLGCTTPFGNRLDNICTDKNQSLKAMELFDVMRDKRFKIDECPYPCKFIKSLLIPNIIRKIESEANGEFELYFGKFIKVTNSYYSYTELELLAEFGGYVGLFLGVSVSHLNQALDRILDYLMPY